MLIFIIWRRGLASASAPIFKISELIPSKPAEVFFFKSFIILRTVSSFTGLKLKVRLVLAPDPELSEMPLQKYYRFALDVDGAPRAKFASLPKHQVLTLRVEELVLVAHWLSDGRVAVIFLGMSTSSCAE